MTEMDFKNPFSQAFRDNLQQMSETIQRLDERFGQIEKSAADVGLFNPDEGEGGDKVVFFECGSGGGDAQPINCTSNDAEKTLTGVRYVGEMFEVGPSANTGQTNVFRTFNVAPAIGYDIYTAPNVPDEYPPVAEILMPPDELDPGTIVMGRLVQNTYGGGATNIVVFSSVLPRLSVRCLTDEEGGGGTPILPPEDDGSNRPTTDPAPRPPGGYGGVR